MDLNDFASHPGPNRRFLPSTGPVDCGPHSSVQWSLEDAGTYEPSGPSCAHLPPGAYAVTPMLGGLFQFRARHLKADELIDFPGELSAEVLHEIDRFWSLGQRYHELGYLHRRGYLFYGSPGCGKSSLVHKVVQRDHGGGPRGLPV